MKQTISLILALAAAMTLAACSKKQDPDPVADTTDQVAQTQPIEEDTEQILEVEERVILEEKDVRVTLKSFDADGFLGPSLRMLIENKTDRPLVFSVADASVNGYMISTLMFAEVKNGAESTEDVAFLSDDLALAGIETVEEMEFCLLVIDSESSESYIKSAPISVRTNAEDVKEPEKLEGSVAYVANGIEITVGSILREESALGKEIPVYIANDTDRDIIVQVRNMRVNAKKVTTAFSKDIFEGKRCVDTVTVFDSELEKNEITEIERIELSFCILDKESLEIIETSDMFSVPIEK